MFIFSLLIRTPDKKHLPFRRGETWALQVACGPWGFRILRLHRQVPIFIEKLNGDWSGIFCSRMGIFSKPTWFQLHLSWQSPLIHAPEERNFLDDDFPSTTILTMWANCHASPVTVASVGIQPPQASDPRNHVWVFEAKSSPTSRFLQDLPSGKLT